VKNKDLKINFRYLGGNIACLSVDSIAGESIHNDINNEEAIIIFNSLVGEKENCQTVKTLLKENQELKEQLETYEIEGYEQNEELNKMSFDIRKYKVQQKEFIKYLEDEIETINKVERHLHQDRIPKYFELGGVIGEKNATKEILQKYKEIIGVSDENKRN
jgi:hypothetical protein